MYVQFTSFIQGEDLINRTANWSNQARLDKQIRCFLERRQQALFNLRIFDHNSCWFHNKTLQRCHALKTNKRKRYYKGIVPQFEHSIFSPLILHKKFSIEDFLGKCNQIRSFLRIWSHLQKKSLMGNFIFCRVCFSEFREVAMGRKLLLKKCPYSDLFWSVFPRIRNGPEQLRIKTLFTQWTPQVLSWLSDRLPKAALYPNQLNFLKMEFPKNRFFP